MRLARDLAVLACAMAPVFCAAQSSAQTLRDPTLPPAALNPAPAGVLSPIDSFRPEHIVIVGGKRLLVWNGRRYAVGDTIQGARIERISETEVWLRNAGALRKLPLFPGVEKKPPRNPASNNSSGRPEGMKGQAK